MPRAWRLQRDQLGRCMAGLLVVSGLLCSVWIGLGAQTTAKAEPPTPPRPGLVTPVRVVEVYDGDTVTVEWTLRARVRLLDCWAPEIRTTDTEEKQRGLAAKAHLQQLCDGQQALLEIPTSEASGLQELFTFGRVLGRIWVGEQDVSAQMVRDGFATARKSIHNDTTRDAD